MDQGTLAGQSSPSAKKLRMLDFRSPPEQLAFVLSSFSLDCVQVLCGVVELFTRWCLADMHSYGFFWILNFKGCCVSGVVVWQLWLVLGY